MINVTLTRDLLDQLDAQCAEFGLSQTEAIEEAVKLWLAQSDGRRWIARCAEESQVA